MTHENSKNFSFMQQEAPPTDVLKSDWRLCKLIPLDARNSQHLFRIKKLNMVPRQAKIAKHECHKRLKGKQDRNVLYIAVILRYSCLLIFA